MSYTNHCGGCKLFFPVSNKCKHPYWLAQHLACGRFQEDIAPEMVSCPFCKEPDFDFEGLKYHLNLHCDVYKKVWFSAIKLKERR